MREYKNDLFIKGGLSLGIFHNENSNFCDFHTHEFSEIVYVTGGKGVESIGGTEHKASRGDLLFINRGAVHKVTPVSNYSYINVCFSPEILGERIITRENAFDLLSLTAIEEIRHEYGAEYISFLGEERRLIEALLFDMLKEFNSSLDERSAVLESYMTILIAKILRKRRMKSTSNTDDMSLWRELSLYIDDNLNKRLSLGDLAKKCFYNPSYFSRIFKEKFGTPLAHHIMHERTAFAARLLTEGELSMDGIAEKCGFGDRTALYRAFMRFYGTSPAVYRKTASKK